MKPVEPSQPGARAAWRSWLLPAALAAGGVLAWVLALALVLTAARNEDGPEAPDPPPTAIAVELTRVPSTATATAAPSVATSPTPTETHTLRPPRRNACSDAGHPPRSTHTATIRHPRGATTLPRCSCPRCAIPRDADRPRDPRFAGRAGADRRWIGAGGVPPEGGAIHRPAGRHAVRTQLGSGTPRWTNTPPSLKGYRAGQQITCRLARRTRRPTLPRGASGARGAHAELPVHDRDPGGLAAGADRGCD